MDVRVGIVVWNTADLVDRCLAAVPAALGSLDAEVVVVDNASTDGSVDAVRKHEVVLIRSDENVGYARAMNRALSSGGPAPRALIALNPDTEPPPGSLEALVRVLDQEPDAGLVVPRLIEPDGTVQHSVYRFPSITVAAAAGLLPGRLQRGALGRRLWLEAGSDYSRSRNVDWAIGAVHCIRTAAIDDQPPYRETSFMYAEDLDLCWRLGRDGWRVVYDADTTVPHVGNAAGGQAWGPSRTERWLTATYDWMLSEHGSRRTRAWAAVNLVAASARVSLLWTSSRRSLARTRGGGRRRHQAQVLARSAKVHARRVLSPGTSQRS